MKRAILFTLLSVFYIGTINAQNTWLKTFGGDNVEDIHIIETDDEGNIYVAGRVNADLHIADTVIKKIGSSSSSIYNYFLLKFNKQGQYVWAHNFRATVVDRVSGVAIDKNHNVYMSLYKPSYYYKYDSTGKQLFEKRINAFNGRIGSIAIDDEGYTWIGCSFNKGPFKLDNLPAIDPKNKPIMFIAKLDSNGTGRFIKTFASNSVTSQISKIAVRDSFVYAIGNTQFDIVVGTDTLKDCDMMVAKFNTSGEYKWAKGITGSFLGTEHVNAITVSKNHQVVITGSYGKPIFVENITLPNPVERDMLFLISYDKSGKLLWAKNSSTVNASGINIEFTPDNTIAVAALYAFNFAYGGINVGDGVSAKRYPAIMEVDTQGNPLWINSLGQVNWTYIRALDVDSEGNWFVGGKYTAEPNTTIDGKNIGSLGNGDLYLLKNFTVPKPVATNKTFCGSELNKQLTATGAGIRWYSDSALTNLVFVGDKFPITATTTYYVVQKAGGAISVPVKVVATILPATQVNIQTTFPVLTALPKTGKNYKC